MSVDDKSNGSVDPVIRPFVDFWMNAWKRTDDTTREMLGGIAGATDAKAWQRRWHEAVSQSLDSYMRSPAFLQSIKQNTDSIIKAKQQVDDLACEFARNANIPTASDISGLFERLHSVESAILGRLERIDERLSAIEEVVGVEMPSGAS